MKNSLFPHAKRMHSKEILCPIDVCAKHAPALFSSGTEALLLFRKSSHLHPFHNAHFGEIWGWIFRQNNEFPPHPYPRIQLRKNDVLPPKINEEWKFQNNFSPTMHVAVTTQRPLAESDWHLATSNAEKDSSLLVSRASPTPAHPRIPTVGERAADLQPKWIRKFKF